MERKTMNDCNKRVSKSMEWQMKLHPRVNWLHEEYANMFCTLNELDSFKAISCISSNRIIFVMR